MRNASIMSQGSAIGNAIFRAEREHITRSDSPRHPLIRVFVWFLVSIGLLYFVWGLIDAIPQHPSLLLRFLEIFNVHIPDYYLAGHLNDTLTPLSLIFPVCVGIWEVWLTLRTLSISTTSIIRERHSGNWELLLLTGAPVPQILWAKWRAIVSVQFKEYAVLAIMQIGAVCFVATNVSVSLTYGMFPYFSFGSPGPETESDKLKVYLAVLSIVLVSFVIRATLTILNLMLTTACGLLGSSLTLHCSSAAAFLSAMGIRVFSVLLICVLTALPGYLGIKPDIETFGYYPNPVFSTVCLILFMLGVTMVDGGSVAAFFLIRFGYYYRWFPIFEGFTFFSDTLRGHGPAFFTGLLMGIVLFVLMTFFIMSRATTVLTRRDIPPL